MNYVTRYDLRVSYDAGVDPETTAEVIVEYLGSNPTLNGVGLIPDTLPYELAHCVGHWYDYETDIKLLARRFPGCTFTLHGKGEEADDEWETEFKGNSLRYHAVTIGWSDWRDGFEGQYGSAYYTIYMDIPKSERISEICPRVIEWMRTNSMDWAQTFDLNTDRSVKTLESNGSVEWYGYAQMRDLAKAFPNCTFELRCVPAQKGPEYVYKVRDNEEHFKQMELTWTDWSEWR